MNRLVLVAIAGLCAACSGDPIVHCESFENGCICDLSSEHGDDPGRSCKATDFSPGRCCASSSSYPDGGSCTCAPLVCGKDSASSPNCGCSYNPLDTYAVPTSSCVAPANGACCVDPQVGQCLCSAAKCGGFIQVDSCNADAVGCLPRETEVTSCAGAVGGGTCVNKQGGTDMAPCVHDSDCLSNFCDETGHPGPYCHVPQPQDIAAGRGLTCSTDASCQAAQPGFSGVGKCHTGSPDIYTGCEFYCP